MKGSRSRRWSGKTKIRKRPKQTKRISLPLGSVILTLGLGVAVFTDCTDGDLSTNTSTSLGVDQVMIYLFWRLTSSRLRRSISNAREWSWIGNIGLVMTVFFTAYSFCLWGCAGRVAFGVNLSLMSLHEYSGVTLDALRKAPKSISWLR